MDAYWGYYQFAENFCLSIYNSDERILLSYLGIHLHFSVPTSGEVEDINIVEA